MSVAVIRDGPIPGYGAGAPKRPGSRPVPWRVKDGLDVRVLGKGARAGKGIEMSPAYWPAPARKPDLSIRDAAVR